MSNLLDKASIVTTPTAYDNGKILSVKPAPSLGSELVTNGDFATDTDWTKGTGWTISGGVATANNVPNLQRLQQGLGTSIIGSKYKYSINISNVSGFYSVYIFLYFLWPLFACFGGATCPVCKVSFSVSEAV